MSRADFNAGAEAMAEIMTDDDIVLAKASDIDVLLDQFYEEHVARQSRLAELKKKAREVIRRVRV